MYRVYGGPAQWPSKLTMANLLTDAGFDLYVGRYSIRINDFDHFVFQEYGGDLGDPQLDADAEDEAVLTDQVQRVSAALREAGLIHRFEIYSDDNNEIAYIHFGWPKD